MGRLLLYSVFFSVFLLSSFVVMTQEPHYTKYGIEDGLPSDEVYHVIQDSKGYLWFATNQGVSRYDGYEFHNFDLSDGLPDNTIFEIYEDYMGRIWFVSFSLKLSYYYKGEIHQYSYNERLINTFYKNRIENKLAFYVDTNDNVYVGLRNYGVLKIDSFGNTTRLSNGESRAWDVFNLGEKSITTQTHRNYDSVRVHGNESIVTIKQPVVPQTDTRQNNDFVLKYHDGFFLSHRGNLYQLKDNKLEKKKAFNQNIVWISKHEESELWVSTPRGAYLVDSEKFTVINKYLEEHLVTSVLKDKEGGYWFTTRDAGVFYTPNIHFVNYNKSDGLISDKVDEITIDSSGFVWFGYKEPYITYHKNGEFENIKLPEEGIDGLYNICYDEFENRILISRHNGLYVYRDQTISKLKSNPPLDILPLENDTLWFSFSEGIRKFINGKLNYHSCREDSFCMRINKIYKDFDNTLYLGGLDGLWVYRNGKYEHMGHVHEDLYYRITDINRMGEYLILATRGAGLILLSDKGNFSITEEDGLISNSVNVFDIDGDIIWIGTNNGISKVHITNTGSFPDFDICNISGDKGLAYPQVNDIEVFDTLVYAATPKGLTCFPGNKIVKNPVAPKIHIRNVEINGIDTIPKSSYKLKHNQNFITIEFIGLSYRQEGDVRYKYQLIGLDTNWSYTTKRSKSYIGLPPGEYEFSVAAQNEDGVWSRNPQTISFEINRPFYNTWWFILLVFSVVSGFVVFFVYYRIRMIRKRNALMHDINEYKQKILRQQMNPHFIFNTLNSIQYFLLDEDTTSSLTYLTKFAKMMRIVLDNSQHTFVPIEDEIRGLDLYLELESLRFEESFDYEIVIDDKINPFEYKIPALLLQPYVENSIRHGLLHKKERGQLKVEIKLSDSSLFCIIEDNGIGRKRAEEIKMSKGPLKKSLGSKLTEDRIKVLNSLYSNEIDINYVDLTDSNGNAAGTRVEIRLPFIY